MVKPRFYGQWNPPVDEVLFRNYFEAAEGGFFVECGAANGVEESCCKFFAERGWKGINIEPEIGRFTSLQENRPGERNLMVCLSNVDGFMYFNPGPHEQMPPAEAGHLCRSMTWETLCVTEGLLGKRIDLLVLDVEGHELQVVEGMADSVGLSVLPDVICAEYPWRSTGLAPLTEALHRLGYHRNFLSYNNAFFSREERRGPFFGETREYLPGELG